MRFAPTTARAIVSSDLMKLHNRVLQPSSSSMQDDENPDLDLSRYGGKVEVTFGDLPLIGAP